LEDQFWRYNVAMEDELEHLYRKISLTEGEHIGILVSEGDVSEVDNLLFRPVSPGATNEDLGCDPANTEITCMEYTASSIAIVLLTQGERPPAGSTKQRGPLSLKR
jgi:hypothetical protein